MNELFLGLELPCLPALSSLPVSSKSISASLFYKVSLVSGFPLRTMALPVDRCRCVPSDGERAGSSWTPDSAQGTHTLSHCVGVSCIAARELVLFCVFLT